MAANSLSPKRAADAVLSGTKITVGLVRREGGSSAFAKQLAALAYFLLLGPLLEPQRQGGAKKRILLRSVGGAGGWQLGFWRSLVAATAKADATAACTQYNVTQSNVTLRNAK